MRLAGAAAAGVSLIGLSLVSSLMPSIPFAPASLAQVIIRLTPVSVSNFFIERIGHLAQQLLTLGAIVGALVLGAEASVTSARGWPASCLGSLRPPLRQGVRESRSLG